MGIQIKRTEAVTYKYKPTGTGHSCQTVHRKYIETQTEPPLQHARLPFPRDQQRHRPERGFGFELDGFPFNATVAEVDCIQNFSIAAMSSADGAVSCLEVWRDADGSRTQRPALVASSRPVSPPNDLDTTCGHRQRPLPRD